MPTSLREPLILIPHAHGVVATERSAEMANEEEHQRTLLPQIGETHLPTLVVDEGRRSLTFAGDMPQGSTARLMRANTDKLVCSAAQAARQAVQSLPKADDALIISVSCVGRRLILGERTEEEIETVLDGAPLRTAHVGFYSYGEISPSVPGGVSELHNQTMTVTVFSEA